MPEFAGLPSGVGRRMVVLASRFNEPIVKKLVDGALQALLKYGVLFEDIDVVWVPGEWELQNAARWLLANERYDGLVAVGAVIRGETAHFDYIAGEASLFGGDGKIVPDLRGDPIEIRSAPHLARIERLQRSRASARLNPHHRVRVG